MTSDRDAFHQYRDRIAELEEEVRQLRVMLAERMERQWPLAWRLTVMESRFLSVLADVNGRAATKRYIFETLYHDRTPDEWPDVKCLDQYVAKIRRKLPADQAARLVTVWGIGWRWISEKENPAP